jgi:hypothetical protein
VADLTVSTDAFGYLGCSQHCPSLTADKNGRGAQRQHAAGLTTEQHCGETASPLGPHHNEIATSGFCSLEKSLRRDIDP